MLYQRVLYGTPGGFQGGGLLGGSPEGMPPGGPIELKAYQNSADRVILYWTHEPYTLLMLDPQFVWTVETDTVNTFDSADHITYTSDTVGDDYLVGCLHVGMSVPLYTRNQGAIKIVYWRVQGTYGNFTTNLSAAQTYNIQEAIDVISRDTSLAYLPDILYKKSSDTNIYKIHDAFAQQFNIFNKELQLVDGDAYLSSVRDSNIDANFGVLSGINIPYGMSRLDYREIVAAFIKNIRLAPTQAATTNMIYAMYRTIPTYSLIRETEDVYIVENEADSPYAILNDSPTLPYALDVRNFDFGVIINIENLLGPGCQQIISEAFATKILRNMVQAHVPIYLQYS